MNIYIIRHAEPDYEHDSLTEKGWREAELLAIVCLRSGTHFITRLRSEGPETPRP